MAIRAERMEMIEGMVVVMEAVQLNFEANCKARKDSSLIIQSEMYERMERIKRSVLETARNGFEVAIEI